MDVVVPYRKSYSDEIRYMLRSLKNIPHNEVYIIGDDPSFITNYIPYPQTSDVAQNTLNILNMAVNNPEISEDFIWIHDDTYILNPLEKLPVYHRGRYADILDSYKEKHMSNYYTRRMNKTYNALIELGIKNPLCYELHIPFVINKTKWKDVSEHIKPDLNKLSMYGNLNKIGGTKIADVKVRARNKVPTGDFISTHDSTFGVNKAGRLVRRKFHEKSRYER